jgi:hypothetical protein
MVLCAVFVLATARMTAAERQFKFDQFALDQCPTGFVSVVTGGDKPGDWKIVLDEAAPVLEPLTSKAEVITRKAVLTESGRIPRATHFPTLIFEKEAYEDFRLTTRFKIGGGVLEQVAGIVFHFQNESNYYLVCADALQKNFRCYKVENGVFRPPFGSDMEVAAGVWHELTVECESSRILCMLDGKDAIKLIDNSYAGKTGKVGFWTKSDSASYFGDTKITYATRERLAQALVKQAMQEYPRVVAIRIFAVSTNGGPAVVVGSVDETELGRPGGATMEAVISQGTSYYSKESDNVVVTMPLRDRNGDPIAAVRIVMKSFPGQTMDNARVRADPIVKQIQKGVQTLHDLLR